MLESIRYFVFKNYTLILVAIIVVAAAFLRLYRIQDYLTFLGDEGRDVLIVRDILHGHLTLLGPRASAADFFTGPIYYYMMAPFLFAANYNPVGPAIMIALFGIATVYLIYRFGKEWFGEPAAIAASALYAVSPLVISYSRSSWNPNPMPFFSILIFYLLYRLIQKPKLSGFLLAGVLYGIAFQLHYIEVFVGVIIVMFVLFGNLILRTKDPVLKLIKQYSAIFTGFAVGMSPFLAFEVRHGFPNTRTVINFIIYGDPKAHLTQLTFIQIVSDVFLRLFGRLVLFYPDVTQLKSLPDSTVVQWNIAVVVLGIGAVIALFRVKNKLTQLLFGLWLLFGVVLFGFYRKSIYDYYFEFMFPLPFLLVGNLFSYFWEKGRLLKIFAGTAFLVVLLFNLSGNPFRYPPNRQYQQVKTIAEFILTKAGNKPFNFALLAGGNSDHAYRYIFTIEGKPPVTIEYSGVDPERKSVTNQLFVICEETNCKPLGNSLWEVAGFGQAEIAGEWPVSIFKVYKLIHFKGAK